MFNQSRLDPILGTSSVDEQDRVYYNININNPTFPQSAKKLAISYAENRDKPILDYPNHYNLSIIRFAIPQNTLPLCNLYSKPFPNVNPLDTIYSVTLQHNADISRAYLQAIPPDTTISAPQTPTADNPYFEVNGYTFVYEWEILMDIINNAFETAFNALIGPPAGSLPPRVEFNRDDGIISLIVQRGYYDSSIAMADRIDIYFNNDLVDNFLSAFDMQKVSADDTFDPNGKDFKIRVIDNPSRYYQPPYDSLPSNVVATAIAVGPTPVITIPSGQPYSVGQFVKIVNSNSTPVIDGLWLITAVTSTTLTLGQGPIITAPGTYAVVVPEAAYYKLQQSFRTSYLSSFVKSIVFRTNTIPVASEYVRSVKTGTTFQGTPQFDRILTDLEPIYSTIEEQRSRLVYIPPGQNRYISLTSQTPLKTFDLEVRFLSRDNISYPIYLSRGGSCDIKILFEKKWLSNQL